MADDKGKETVVEIQEASPETEFDWFGGPSDRQGQDMLGMKEPESETIMGTIRKIIPRPVRVTFFVLLGLALIFPSLFGLLGIEMPKYFGIDLNVYTNTGLTLLYLPGFIILVVGKLAQCFRRSLVWSKTELPSYIEAISLPLAVAVCGSILYGMWAIELPGCEPGQPNCYWKYVHRLYYVMLGACVAFSIEVALMRQWCNNYRRQTYQAKIVDNRFKSYIVEQMKIAAKAKKEGGDEETGQAFISAPGSEFIGGLFSKLKGYAPIPLPIDMTKMARIRDFSWFKKQVNSVVLMENYQNIGKQQIVSDLEARGMAKDIFETLCPPDRDYLVKEDFAEFFPPDALDDAYYVFDKDRDGEITKLEFRNTITDIFTEQRHLAKAISDADMAISKLNTIVVTAMWIVIGFTGLIACDVAVENMLTLSLSTILGINVIIGDVVRSILSSIMFVFVNHPYDIGDIVLVGEPDAAEVLTVQRVDLLTTVFRRWNCQELYFANHVLITMPVTNLSRSPDQWERIDFVLPSTVNEQQLDELRDTLMDFFRENSADFFTNFDLRAIVAADSGMAESDLDTIRFTLRVRCKPTNDAEKQWNRHGRLVRLVRELTMKCQ